MKKASSFLRLLPPLIWAGYAILLIKSLFVRVLDYDLWWHLASGRIMVEKEIFLREDIFSHTYLGAEWINFEWLSQILFYLFVKFSGIEAIFYAKVALSLAVIAMLGWLLKSNGARGLGLLVTMILGFLALRPRLYERVELFSLFFMAVFVFFLSRARNQPPPLLKNIPWILFGLMIVWCNLHAGFIYGLGFVFLIAIGARWARESREYVSMVNLTLILLAIGVLINPFGPHLFKVMMEVMGQYKSGLHMIQEWAPPSVKAVPVFWGLFVAAAVLLVAGLNEKRPEATFWGPAVVLFAAWGGMSFRNTALAAFVLLPFIVDIVSKWERLHQIRSHPYLHYAGWGACLLLLATQTHLLIKPMPREKVQWSRFPVAASRFVEEHGVRGKMYNTYELGGYIQWVLGPERKVMMDGRYLFQPILLEHERLNNELFHNPAGNGWPASLARGGIDYAITSYGDFVVPKERGGTPFPLSPLNAMFPRSEWALVFWDDAALVFLKRVPSMAEVIRQNEYRALWPYNPDQMEVLVETGGVSKEEALKELARHRDQVGFTVLGSELEKRING